MIDICIAFAVGLAVGVIAGIGIMVFLIGYWNNK